MKVPWNEGVTKPRFSVSVGSREGAGEASVAGAGLMSTEKLMVRGAEASERSKATSQASIW